MPGGGGSLSLGPGIARRHLLPLAPGCLTLRPAQQGGRASSSRSSSLTNGSWAGRESPAQPGGRPAAGAAPPPGKQPPRPIPGVRASTGGPVRGLRRQAGHPGADPGGAARRSCPAGMDRCDASQGKALPSLGLPGEFPGQPDLGSDPGDRTERGLEPSGMISRPKWCARRWSTTGPTGGQGPKAWPGGDSIPSNLT